MSNLWRIVDVEYNRVTEGLRVLEDLARFYWENAQITAELKSMRSKIAQLANCFHAQLLLQRDAGNDLGLEVSQNLRLDSRNNLVEMVTSNFKRVQEGLRSLEEYLKVLNYYNQAKEFELLRYQTYRLEKMTAFHNKSNGRFLRTDIYAITASEYSLSRSNLEVVKQLLEAEIKVIQYREKDLTMLQKYRECVQIRELTAEYGATFIVNDDLHLALAVQADGVHLGQDDLPLEQVRDLTQGQILIGFSTHSPEQADLAVKAGVDYIGVGPLFRTFTKKNVGEPVGLAYLDYVVSHHQIPFVAIGGIKQHNIGEVVRHGAQCIALVTEIVGAEDIAAKIKELRREIHQAREELS